MRRRIMVLALALGLALAPGPAGALERGPIDAGQLARMVIESATAHTQARGTAVQQGPTTVGMSGSILDSVLSANSWILTRAILFGVTGMESARQQLEDPETLYAICGPDKTSREILSKIGTQGGTESKDSWESRIRTEIQQAKYRYDRENFTWGKGESGFSNISNKVYSVLKLSTGLSAIAKFQALLPGAGSDGQGSLYKAILYISKILLMVGCVAQITFLAYQTWVSSNQDAPTQMASTLVKFTMILILVNFLDDIAWTGIQMSDNVKNSLAGQGGGVTAFSVVADSIEARLATLGGGQSPSLSELFSQGAGALVAWLLAWGAYYIGGATLYVLMLLADMSMALTLVTGPAIFSMSLFPSCEGWIQQWCKKYVETLMWAPLIAVYAIFFMIIMSCGYSTSYMDFIVIMIAYIVGASRVPQLARIGSGVAGAVASQVAGMPAGMAQRAGRRGLQAVGAGLGAGIGAIAKKMGGSNEKRKAVNAE